MTLSVPPAVNYQSPLIAVPTRWDQAPIEGSKIIPCEVDWGTMGGTSNCVSFNLQNNATLNFSQIVALSIDNSACGADIEFIFPDTSETLSIPAYAPKTVVPVFTNQTQFWLSCPNAQSEDITRFSILNSMPPPIAVPTTQEQDAAIAANVAISGAAGGSQQMVPTTTNGTLEGANLSYQINNGSVAAQISWIIEDGTGAMIAAGQLAAPANSSVNGIAFSLSELRVRFQQGIVFSWSNLSSNYFSTPSAMAVNIFYRTP